MNENETMNTRCVMVISGWQSWDGAWVGSEGEKDVWNEQCFDTPQQAAAFVRFARKTLGRPKGIEIITFCPNPPGSDSGIPMFDDGLLYETCEENGEITETSRGDLDVGLIFAMQQELACYGEPEMEGKP